MGFQMVLDPLWMIEQCIFRFYFVGKFLKSLRVNLFRFLHSLPAKRICFSQVRYDFQGFAVFK